MKNRYPAELLREAWISFLQQRGHEVSVPERITDAITSYRKQHNSFRWLLFVAEGQVKRLTPSERRRLAREIETAREEDQRPYVVVRFTVPSSKIVIMPAENVLETGDISSARGGIPWFE
jgi:hypothetical protein